MTEILVSDAQGLRTIRIDRPEKKNELTGAMYDAMAAALQGATRTPALRAVLITGGDACFTSGNDVADFKARGGQPAEVPSPARGFLAALRECPKPVVAAVAGYAVGIGTTLLLHCDLVYAGDNAAFSLPFANLGLCPEAASSLLVPQMFGYHRAAEALLLGDPFMAEAALEVGLVNRVLPPT